MEHISIDTSRPVLVTGATGYVAGWVVKRLLDRGVTVHATVRDPNNTAKLRHLRALDPDEQRLHFFKADLLERGSFAEAMRGCQVVFHIASPYIISVNDPQKELVEPAVRGTRNVLEQVNATPSVERVVLTSSCAAIFGDSIDLQATPRGVFDESVWNTTSSLDHGAYSYSKTLAEKEAWAIHDAQRRWRLVVVNPAAVMGPGIGPHEASESSLLVKQMGDGTMRMGVPDIHIGVIDVRDLAEAHLRCAFLPNANGRHVLVGHDSSLLEMATVLRETYGDHYPLPRRTIPKPILWLVGPLANKAFTRRFITRNVGLPWKSDNTKSVRELGMSYRTLSETMNDCFAHLVELGTFAPSHPVMFGGTVDTGSSRSEARPRGSSRSRSAGSPERRPRRHRIRRALARIGLIVLGAVAVALLGIKLLYGRGSPYPDVSGVPIVPEAEVAAVVNLEFPPGNVTGSRDGRIFFNLHPLGHLYRFTDSFLFELVDGKPRPYPDVTAQADLHFAFGMTVDAQNRLWLTAPATFERERTRLIAFDLTSNTKVIDHELDRGVARFGQDLRVTPDGKTVLLANSSAFRFTDATVVVVDIATWTAREVLGGHPATDAQDWLIRVRGEPYRAAYGLLSFQAGLDGIAISPDGQSLFLAAMTNDALYRVPLADVLDPALSRSALAARVVRVGKKPLSDGVDAAPDGSVLVTDVEHGGIARVDARGALRTLVKLGQVSWADGVFVAPNWDVYFTDSALPNYLDPFFRPPTLDRLRAGRPYHLYRFRIPGGLR